MKRVLLVDDDEDFLEVLRVILELSGFSVLAKNDPSDVEQDLHKFSPDIAVIDYDLPRIDGLTLAGRIKARDDFDKLPIVMMSAHQDAAALAKISKTDYVLSKPFDADKLIKIIEAL